MGVNHSILHPHKINDIPVQVWSFTNTSNPAFVFPELREGTEVPELLTKPNFGIALSGGGLRAACTALGYLRGLNKLGLLSKARYVSSNSGGSWVALPLAYLSNEGDNVEQFLGPYLPPEECTMYELMKFNYKSHGRVIAHAHFKRELIMKVLDIIPTDHRDFWTKAIGEMFFEPYHLNDLAAIPVAEGLNGARLSETATSLHVRTHAANTMFFPIANASIKADAGIRLFAPVEFTPLYYGIPVEVPLGDGVVGGSYIEPVGFTSKLTATHMEEGKSELSKSRLQGDGDSHTFTMNVPPPTMLLTPSHQGGLSSTIIGEYVKLTHGEAKLAEFPIFPLFNIRTDYSGDVEYCDGDGSDNLGVLALLRRQVTKIIACVSMCLPLDLQAGAESRWTEAEEEERVSNFFACATTSPMGTIAGLFGVQKSKTGKVKGVKDEVYNSQRHVFPAEGWKEVLNGLRAEALKGRPCVYLLKTHVLPNVEAGVRGNHDASILFVVNHESKEWSSKLPPDVEEEINQDITHHSTIHTLLHEAFAYPVHVHVTKFPYIPTERLDYSPLLVGALTNLSCWEMIESKDKILELLEIV